MYDVDTLNGSGSHFDDLDTGIVSFAGSTYSGSNLEIIARFLDVNDSRFNTYASDKYMFAGMNVSIAGSLPTSEELATFSLFEDLGSLIFQSAPNVNQGDFDWGSAYSDVVNVGAWNVANNGELLISSPNTLNTVDILADGYVARDGWGSGWNFGTSFASPKVSAEFLNVINPYLSEIDLPDCQMKILSRQISTILSL